MFYYIFTQHLDFGYSHFLLLLALSTSILQNIALDSPVLSLFSF